MIQTINSILKNEFREERKAISEIDEHTFHLNDGSIAVLDIPNHIFGIKELAQIVSTAENLCEKHKTQVNVFLLAPADIQVTIAEQDIPSEYEFTIKLAKMQETIAETMMSIIENKVENNIKLNAEDLIALHMAPTMCNSKWEQEHVIERGIRIMTLLGL